jgi:hypothetical protein
MSIIKRHKTSRCRAALIPCKPSLPPLLWSSHSRARDVCCHSDEPIYRESASIGRPSYSSVAAAGGGIRLRSAQAFGRVEQAINAPRHVRPPRASSSSLLALGIDSYLVNSLVRLVEDVDHEGPLGRKCLCRSIAASSLLCLMASASAANRSALSIDRVDFVAAQAYRSYCARRLLHQ